jgi:hypothetical protein
LEFKKGETHQARIGLPKPYKIHICEVIDQYWVVYKYYGRSKQYWHYAIEYDSIVENRIKMANP